MLRDLIGDVDALTVQTWHEAMEWLRLSNGDIVFRQGEAPDGMYIVINGRLRVVATTRDGKEQVIAEITPGETVGEFAVLTGEPRSATVYAVRESTVVKIATETFHRLARVNPHFMTEITKIIVARQQRLLDQGKPPAPAALSVALVSAGHSADLDAFAQQLTQTMQPYGKCKTINAQEFDALFGKAGAAQSTKKTHWTDWLPTDSMNWKQTTRLCSTRQRRHRRRGRTVVWDGRARLSLSPIRLLIRSRRRRTVSDAI